MRIETSLSDASLAILGRADAPLSAKADTVRDELRAKADSFEKMLLPYRTIDGSIMTVSISDHCFSFEPGMGRNVTRDLQEIGMELPPTDAPADFSGSVRFVFIEVASGGHDINRETGSVADLPFVVSLERRAAVLYGRETPR